MPRFLTASEYRRQCFAGKPPDLRTVIAQVDRGELPGYRAGRHVYVDVGEIERAIDRQTGRQAPPRHDSRIPTSDDPWHGSGCTPADWLYQNASTYLPSPMALRSRAACPHGYTPPAEQGVYALFLGGVVQYVGQARNVQRRLRQHRQDGLQFDEYATAAPLPSLFLSEIEAFYMALFDPPVNVGSSFLGIATQRILPEARAGKLWN